MEMKEELVLRRATLADVPVILAHRRAMCVEIGWNDPLALAAMESQTRPYLERAVAEEIYRGWLVAAPDGTVAAGGGLLIYDWPGTPHDPRPRRAYILNMYTEPGYRQRGLARRIVQTIIDYCRSEGFKWVTLHASEMGRPIYAGLGFEPVTTEMRLPLK